MTQINDLASAVKYLLSLSLIASYTFNMDRPCVAEESISALSPIIALGAANCSKGDVNKPSDYRSQGRKSKEGTLAQIDPGLERDDRFRPLHVLEGAYTYKCVAAR